jgi:Domain of unknown function (DUF3291)
MRYHLAQVNVGRVVARLDSEQLRPFMEALDPVNAVADESTGFVWRLQTDDGNATALRVFDDPYLIVNMSVWESFEALRSFVYKGAEHLAIMRRRREFFERADDHILALWWIPAGTIPTVADAESRLTLLRAVGPSPEAFTFRYSFPPPGETGGAVRDDRELCPA